MLGGAMYLLGSSYDYHQSAYEVDLLIQSAQAPLKAWRTSFSSCCSFPLDDDHAETGDRVVDQGGEVNEVMFTSICILRPSPIVLFSPSTTSAGFKGYRNSSRTCISYYEENKLIKPKPRTHYLPHVGSVFSRHDRFPIAS
jgi:hypothetical protein